MCNKQCLGQPTQVFFIHNVKTITIISCYSNVSIEKVYFKLIKWDTRNMSPASGGRDRNLHLVSFVAEPGRGKRDSHEIEHVGHTEERQRTGAGVTVNGPKQSQLPHRLHDGRWLHLFCSLLYSQNLEWCLGYSRCSKNSFEWMKAVVVEVEKHWERKSYMQEVI